MLYEYNNKILNVDGVCYPFYNGSSYIDKETDFIVGLLDSGITLPRDYSLTDLYLELRKLTE